jgi:hypothetical protein
MTHTEFQEFVLALDDEIKDGVRAEVALRRIVTKAAESIRQRENPQTEPEPSQ